MFCDRSPRATAPTRGRFDGRQGKIGDQRIDRVDRRRPGAGDVAKRGALRQLALGADHGAQPLELVSHALVELDDFVEGVGDAPIQAAKMIRQADGEVAASKRLERRQQLLLVECLEYLAAIAVGGPASALARPTARRAFGGFPVLHRLGPLIDAVIRPRKPQIERTTPTSRSRALEDSAS
jgi:hypothetical protein